MIKNILDFFKIDKVKKQQEEDNNINALDDCGRTLLFTSIIEGNTPLALSLIEKGINTNIQDMKGQTALHFCVHYYNPEVAKALLENKIEINLTDKYGNNALWTAVFEGRKENNCTLVELFLSYGADMNNINNAGRSPLSFIREIGNEKLLAVLENHNLK